ncbi:MAG: DUF3015 family protein [Deltaproteobacteria bacterium]|nr:DUF3015 family protein [Deltaproteobacteria bacterium]
MAAVAVATNVGAEEPKAEETKAPAAAPAAPAAPAEAAPAPAAGEPKFGPAGCGLGSMIIGGKPGFSQVFAATTNGTSASQTFGISSGTSNCDVSAPAKASARTFVVANVKTLSKEIARGRGETITSLATLSGCQNANAVGATLQRKYKAIFPKAGISSTQVADSIINTLKTDKTLACGNLG